jgi:hypothetical protein
MHIINVNLEGISFNNNLNLVLGLCRSSDGSHIGKLTLCNLVKFDLQSIIDFGIEEFPTFIVDIEIKRLTKEHNKSFQEKFGFKGYSEILDRVSYSVSVHGTDIDFSCYCLSLKIDNGILVL